MCGRAVFLTPAPLSRPHVEGFPAVEASRLATLHAWRCPFQHDRPSHNLRNTACLQMAISAKAAYASQPVTTTAGHRTATTMRSAGGGGGRRRGKSPPDLPSMLLDSRICFIGMPVGWWYLSPFELSATML